MLGYVTLFRHVHQSAYFRLILGTSKRISRQNPNWPRTKNSLNLTETGWLNKIRPLSFTAHIFKISNWYLRFTELDEKKLVLTSWAHFFSWKTNNNFNHIYVKSYLMTHNTISKLFVSTFLTERYYIMFGYCHRNSVRRLSVCLSVCDVNVPYSHGWTFPHYVCTTLLTSHADSVVKKTARRYSQTRGCCYVQRPGGMKIAIFD